MLSHLLINAYKTQLQGSLIFRSSGSHGGDGGGGGAGWRCSAAWSSQASQVPASQVPASQVLDGCVLFRRAFFFRSVSTRDVSTSKIYSYGKRRGREEKKKELEGGEEEDLQISLFMTALVIAHR